MQHKSFDIERKDGWIVASTPTVDRDADRVMPLGMRLENYKANPVIMYGHQYGEPWSLIGRAADIQVDADGIRILPELREPVNDADPMCIIRALWDQGLLKAASIGFNPLRYGDNPFGGKDITESELLEISLVPIPANQAALRLAVKGIGMDEEEDRRRKPVCDEEPGTEKDAGEVSAEADAAADDIETDAMPPEDMPHDEEDEPEVDPDKPTPEQELRLAAILADFVSAIAPYLQQ
jgi:HK97 family phage prohead protease